jgi:hypothetical protein
MTPARAAVARRLAALFTLALLAFPGWRCWRFQNLPDALRVWLNTVAAKLGHYSMTYGERKWAYMGLWACCWLLWPLWTRLFRLGIGATLRKRTVVRFTNRYVILRRFWRRPKRYDRQAAAITFLLKAPNVALREAKARRSGDDQRIVALQQARILLMQYGLDLVPVARFISPEAAEIFSTALSFGNSFPLNPLKRGITAGPQGPIELEVANHADV